MKRKDLALVLELKKEHEKEVFYRYAIGGFVLWFSQEITTGNIYSAAIICKNNEYNDFELFIHTDNETFYPTEFLVSCSSTSKTVKEAKAYKDKLDYVCDVLDEVENFFKTSSHREYYDSCKKRG